MLTGLGITWITGLVQKYVVQDTMSYGWPFAWRIRLILDSQVILWKVNPLWFIVDFTFYGLLIFLVSYILQDRTI